VCVDLACFILYKTVYEVLVTFKKLEATTLKNIQKTQFLIECVSLVFSLNKKEHDETPNTLSIKFAKKTNHTSNQERLPAGLKHLIKPRKRN